MAALDDKVTTIGKEADRLCGIHADHASQIQAKRNEIEEYWERLKAKANVSVKIQSNLFFSECVNSRNDGRNWKNPIHYIDFWQILET